MAVGGERAHTARLGKVNPVGVGRDVAEHEPGLTRRGFDRAISQVAHLIEPPEQQRRSAQARIEPSEKADECAHLTLDKLLTFTEPAQRLTRLAELRQDPGGADDRIW